MLNQVHPTIAAALLPMLPPEAADELKATARYVRALQNFDWRFEFSESADVASRGRQELRVLRAMQVALDPDGAIWLATMPGNADDIDSRRGMPRPMVQAAQVAA